MIGPRGWVYDVFTNDRTASMSAASLAAAAMSWSVTNTSLNGSRAIFTDRLEGRNITTSKLLSRAVGFFVAPRAGAYSFAMIGDDLFQLQGTWHNGCGWQQANLIGIGSWQVGVRVPSSDPSFFSIAEVQRLTIPYRQLQHRQLLSVLFRPPADACIEVILKVATAGTADTGSDAQGATGGAAGALAAAAGPSAAAAGALTGVLARLNDPRIGVNLTIRGTQMPTFPPNISATALQAAVVKAVNGSAVGVEIIQNPAVGTLTYRLLTNPWIVTYLNADGSNSSMTVYEEMLGGVSQDYCDCVLPASVHVNKEACLWRDGYLTGRSWVISWPVEARDAVTHFTANPEPGGYAPGYMMTSAGLLNLASPPLSGAVAVGFGASCATVELRVIESAYGLANKLNSMPGVKGEQ
ncbi:hypothetical protein OEZ86_013629 [Tetradesmus obliquus]|nr:hypothetical protein OEZ86_013629 [Tetradesmus obliquus]